MFDKALQCRITSFLKALKASLENEGKLLNYYKMNLSENSIPTMLFALTHYLNHTGTYAENEYSSNFKLIEDLTTVCLFLIKDICMNNLVAQAQIFKQPG